MVVVKHSLAHSRHSKCLIFENLHKIDHVLQCDVFDLRGGVYLSSDWWKYKKACFHEQRANSVAWMNAVVFGHYSGLRALGNKATGVAYGL